MRKLNATKSVYIQPCEPVDLWQESNELNQGIMSDDKAFKTRINTL